MKPWLRKKEEDGLKVLRQAIRKFRVDASSASMSLSFIVLVLDAVKNGTLAEMSSGGLPNMMSFISASTLAPTAGFKAAAGFKVATGAKTFAAASAVATL